MSTWTNIPPLNGAPSTNYNDPTQTYDSIIINYEGQTLTQWTAQTKEVG